MIGHDEIIKTTTLTRSNPLVFEKVDRRHRERAREQYIKINKIKKNRIKMKNRNVLRGPNRTCKRRDQDFSE